MNIDDAKHFQFYDAVNAFCETVQYHSGIALPAENERIPAREAWHMIGIEMAELLAPYLRDEASLAVRVQQLHNEALQTGQPASWDDWREPQAWFGRLADGVIEDTRRKAFSSLITFSTPEPAPGSNIHHAVWLAVYAASLDGKECDPSEMKVQAEPVWRRLAAFVCRNLAKWAEEDADFYAVVRDDDDDRQIMQIISMFADRLAARRCADLYPEARVELYRDGLNDSIFDDIPAGHKVWHVLMNREGQHICNQVDPQSQQLSLVVDRLWKGQDGSFAVSAIVYAIGKAHAVRQVRRVVEYLVDEEMWPTGSIAPAALDANLLTEVDDFYGH